MFDLVLDPAKLHDQLAAARAARDRLDRVIDWLEDGVALTGTAAPAELEPPPAEPTATPQEPDNRRGGVPMEEPPALPPAPEPTAGAPAPRSTPPMRSGARDRRDKVLSVVLKSNRPLAFAEIHQAVGGGSVTGVRKILQQLVADGQILAEGATTLRRYRRDKGHELHSDLRKRQEATAERNRAKVADGIDRVVFRDKVAKAIAGDPACLNEDRLAQALDADPGDVAEACLWLVQHSHVTANDDGTYTRRANGRARLRAAA